MVKCPKCKCEVEQLQSNVWSCRCWLWEKVGSRIVLRKFDLLEQGYGVEKDERKMSKL